MTEDYKTKMTNGSGAEALLSQLSRDDGADCISDISSLYNPKEDRQTDNYGRRESTETGRLTREMD